MPLPPPPLPGAAIPFPALPARQTPNGEAFNLYPYVGLLLKDRRVKCQSNPGSSGNGATPFERHLS
ncbi:hypothetical protein JMJ77_0009462 [Colletotrichum scovillei]|uniref:Uncharacterized protein n=1 Tax=Colletotrichum scovillei TaxID=1209932 RepID=A0A9P7QXU9_9PEZI|nr:hypothetical protein JMJ77_0009462 [Colletotrichum scovillei]KAG7052541.1 hypothetical protein JMJ78_0005557 [Colletotrichum scovillei]KAG7064833.1 hypothetical protein JMJ76_0012591 [Colletotrichum scovillei]